MFCRRRGVWGVWLLGFALGACHSSGEKGKDPMVGGESHWLQDCTSTLDCGGGAVCICGVCTSRCEGDDDCAGIPGASCTVGADPGDVCGASMCMLASESGEVTESPRGSLAVGEWVCEGLQEMYPVTERATMVSGPLGGANASEECFRLDAAALEGPFCTEEGGVFDALLVDGELRGAVCWPSRGEDLQKLEDFIAADTVVSLRGNTLKVFVPSEGVLSAGVSAVRVDGNRVLLLGDASRRGYVPGELLVEANHTRMRNLSVGGDLSVRKNNAVLMHSRVLGDLTIEGNHAIVARSEILGSVKVRGDNARLGALGIGGEWTAPEGVRCWGCYSLGAMSDGE